MPVENDLLQDAQVIDRALRSIRHEMRRPVESDMNRTPLTMPQMRALDILTQPENLDGMALKDLTRAMGLSQSTVSGIAERLERLKLVQRQTDPRDRRLTRIEAAEGVKVYVQKDLVEQRLGKLLQALKKASGSERATIRSGLEMLERLMVEGESQRQQF